MNRLDIFVARKEGTKGFAGGRLYLNGTFECYTLEDEVREIKDVPVEQWKVKGETAIPRGRYRVIVSKSNRFGKDLPEILNVPGYTGVRIHPGNNAENTEGCLLVGDEDPSDGFMGKSVQAFDRVFARIMDAINTGSEVWITFA